MNTYLVFHELGPVLPLLPRRPLEEIGESGEGEVVAIKVAAHGHVDVGSVQLHVDVLVDQILAKKRFDSSFKNTIEIEKHNSLCIITTLI